MMGSKSKKKCSRLYTSEKGLCTVHVLPSSVSVYAGLFLIKRFVLLQEINFKLIAPVSQETVSGKTSQRDTTLPR